MNGIIAEIWSTMSTKEALHVSVKELKSLTVPKVAALGTSVTELKTHVTELRSLLNAHSLEGVTDIKGHSMHFELHGQLIIRLTQTDRTLRISSFYFNRYHMTFFMHLSESHHGGLQITASINMKKGEYDAELLLPLVGKVHYTLLNQLEDKNHRIKTHNIKQAGHFSDDLPYSVVASDSVKNTQYLKDDAVYYRISLEVPADTKPWLKCTELHLCNTNT